MCPFLCLRYRLASASAWRVLPCEIAVIRRASVPPVHHVLSMLRELREWAGSERECACILGLPVLTVRNWLVGRRKPQDIPSRRVVWLTWALVLHPDQCQTKHDLIFWGLMRRRSLVVPVSHNVSCIHSDNPQVPKP